MPGPIFVTGGSGFIGRSLVSRLRANGETVFAPTRNELDLFDTNGLTEYLRKSAITTVVHLAASLDKGNDRAQWHDTFELGRSVIDASVGADVSLLVMAGTMDEVGRAQGLINTDEAINPSSIYGLCKSLLRQVAQYAAANSKLQIEWVRPTIVYGPGQTGAMAVPAAFTAAIRHDNAQFTSGEQKRDFIYIDDLVDWFARATQLDASTGGVTVHHVGNGTPVALKNVLNGIAQRAGAQFELGALPRREGEADLFGVPTYSDERSALAGWRALTTLESGLDQTWQWWQQNS